MQCEHMTFSVLPAPYLNARKAFSERNVRSATSGTESSWAGAVTVTVCRHSWRAWTYIIQRLQACDTWLICIDAKLTDSIGVTLR